MFSYAIPSCRILGPLAVVATFASAAVAAADARVSESYGKLPLHFEANRGQTHEDVRFLARGAGYGLYLTAGEAVLVLAKPNPDAKRDARSTQARPDAQGEVKSVAVRMSLVGAARKPLVSGLEELPGKANNLIGKDPAKWRTNVPTYARVHYREVYPGIDLVYYGNQRQLEYDFVVAPGADPKKIVLGFKGADKLEIDEQGDLVLHAAGGAIHQKKPVIYQKIDGVRKQIEGGYVRKGAKRVGFQVAAYDRSRPLVIDPVLSYSTYLGSGATVGRAIAVDKAGAAYVIGHTGTAGFPTTAGALDTSFNGGREDAFVTKLNATGTALVYSTFLGGNGRDLGFGIAVDAEGSAYLIGSTTASDFPTTPGAFDTSWNGGDDAFVTKLNSTGSALVYSTFLGGSGVDGDSGIGGPGIAVDATGAAHVTGFTTSVDFPTTSGAFQPVFGGGSGGVLSDAFVTKLDAAGSTLAYSTFLGGISSDRGVAIAIDATGVAYVTGFTQSSNFPTTPGAFDTSFNGGSDDAFVAKLNATGSAVVYSTFLGGSGPDFGFSIAVDATDAVYVTGTTHSINFPTTAGAFDTSFDGGDFKGDAFVTKLDAAGSALVYSTFLGGSDGDGGGGIAIDATGVAYVTGSTSSTDFPTTPGAFDTSSHHSSDVFVTKLDATGSALLYSTYLGGSSIDAGRGIALDAMGAVYVTGQTFSSDFPTTPGAFDTSGGTPVGDFPDTDAFITKLALGTPLLVIDKDSIDDGKAPNFFLAFQVNDDVADIGVRAQLRFFRDQIGQTITLPTGQIGNEGWFTLKTVPASWAQAGGLAGYVGNPGANPEDPPPHGTGPGLARRTRTATRSRFWVGFRMSRHCARRR